MEAAATEAATRAPPRPRSRPGSSSASRTFPTLSLNRRLLRLRSPRSSTRWPRFCAQAGETPKSSTQGCLTGPPRCSAPRTERQRRRRKSTSPSTVIEIERHRHHRCRRHLLLSPPPSTASPRRWPRTSARARHWPCSPRRCHRLADREGEKRFLFFLRPPPSPASSRSKNLRWKRKKNLLTQAQTASRRNRPRCSRRSLWPSRGSGELRRGSPPRRGLCRRRPPRPSGL